MQPRFYYVIHLQYLGFRYSGWQKQPGQRTVESMLIKTLKFIIPDRKIKILSAGRTDAKVSALDMAFELFVWGTPIDNLIEFVILFNKNLPPDIRVLHMHEVDSSFNIIQHSKQKEYVYLFSFGQKNHPFAAPFMANIMDELDVSLMQEGACLFVGTHNFSCYTARPQENTKVIRTLTHCTISPNTYLTANFFPKKSYALCMASEGFMRYQVRMIMGALILLGKGALSLDAIAASLTGGKALAISFVAPGSGLVLNKTEFKS
ncbi:tRNA pseudouridine(38-40) synthase TruA [Arenibacter sp. GZD96]|uniref:tRNA pseudouridine synthase A n=1 Tax=Aurantibrevibacter litoralis TaxID=3106030 RepID=UPI002AFE8A89|nr:hypothetical protein [Arenibacter sp. GZD-96]MEA1785312.1 tRNA pseudouridine(38-40) synthase TruA [Arenibacter sp. GZD-96]